MAVLDLAASSELCEDNNSKWKNTLRGKASTQEKPQWKAAVKVRSPSEKCYAEGGSLRTNRQGKRGRSETRSTRSRSPSPGIFGSTAASRAKQREAILARSRSASMAPTPDSRARRRPSDSEARRARNRSESPVRRVREARTPSRPPTGKQDSQHARKPSLTSIMKQSSEMSSSSQSNSSYSGSIVRSETDSVDSSNKTAIWVAPKENPLEFEYFKKNFLDFNDEYQYCYTSSEYKTDSSTRNMKNAKKKVSYADCKKFVSLGFRVL